MFITEFKMKTLEVEDKIDLTKIVKALWQHKRQYLISCAIAMVIGAIFALSIPNTYKSQIVLAPEMSNNSLSDKFSGLAAMAGLNLGSINSSVDAVYPMIYPNVIESTPFVLELFDVKIPTKDAQGKKITFYEYLEKHQKASLLSLFLSLFHRSPSEDATAVNSKTGDREVIHLTEKQMAIKKAVNKMVTCHVDKRTDIITLSVVSQDPIVSAILVDTVACRLQQYIIKYRTSKAESDLNYSLKIQQEEKTRFEEAQQQYTSFADKHIDVVFETPRQRLKTLENDMNLKYQTYSQVTQQVQLAKAKVQERTPVFTVIEPAVVPTRKNAPARTLIVLGFIFIAFIGTSVWILVKR